MTGTPPRWVRGLARTLSPDHRDDIILDLIEERARIQTRGHSRLYGAAWLFAHLVRSAMASRRAWAEPIWQDARYGIRLLRRTPGFAAMAVVVLALGIGANTAVFSLVNALFLRPLPVRSPNELAFVYPKGSMQGLSCAYDELLSYRADRDLIKDAVGINEDFAGIGSGADGSWISGEAVTGNYFEMLGLHPRMGRSFTSAIDDAPDAEGVVIISDRLWRTKFQADPNILGREIRLRNSQMSGTGWPYTIVGVMGPEFVGVTSPWTAADFWAPMSQRNRESTTLYVSVLPTFQRRVGLVLLRRQPNASTQAIQDLVTARHAAFERASTSRGPARASADSSLVVLDSRRFLLPLDERGQIEPSHLASALLALAALVLLLAVSNLAGIVIARSIVRRPEIAMRLTLGATRSRLARQLVTEGLVLSALGGVVGMLWSRAVVGAFVGSLPSALGSQRLWPVGFDVPIDLRVLGFTVVAVIAVGAAVGLASLRQASRTDLVTVLATAAEPAPRHLRSRLRHWIVVPQVTICTALLVAAAVSTEALLKVTTVDLGYQRAGAATTIVSMPFMPPGLAAGSPDERRKAIADRGQLNAAFFADLLDRVRAMPGVVAAAYGSSPTSGGTTFPIVSEGPGSRLSEEVQVFSAGVTTDYFDAVGLPLLAGRAFVQGDLRDTSVRPDVVILDASAAQRLWPGQSAVGKLVGLHDHNITRWVWLPVIGVVGNVRLPLGGLETRPSLYLPRTRPEQLTTARLVVRTRDSLRDLTRGLRFAVNQLSPDAVLSPVRSLDDIIDEVRYPRRLASSLLVASAVVGLLLAALGLYGVVSYSVAQRMKELGIRAALGATRRDLAAVVIREGTAVTILGSAIGFLLAYIGIRVVSHNVFAMPGMDGVTMVVVPLVLATVVGLACYLPARRAGRVDPMIVLRWL